jgi:hypothetical protein
MVVVVSPISHLGTLSNRLAGCCVHYPLQGNIPQIINSNIMERLQEITDKAE